MHDGLVNICNIERAVESVVKLGPDSLGRLSEVEPVLADYIDESATRIAGKMIRSGCEDSVARGVAAELITTAVIALEALRDGHYGLWRSDASTSIVDSHDLEEGEQPDD